ncbi:non-specific lipid-transfer A-like [Olea europaea subsp. europaea]|uniref:Non-specific lipid-transfer protein n=1 Tax=Olea europaea subsp. europaea TaxID=158383 RepID=A0A8S0SGI8_OLEEU|nr:non-specific lipid-transfer A-like [Olea europaea subsp. europaea]
MKGFAVILLVVVAMVQLFMAKPGAAISCGQVESQISPCLTYLSEGGTPSPSCCSGVKTLSQSLQTTQDRQTACGCLKTAASHYTNLKPDAASQLPTKCGVSIGVPISPTVDCSKIQ